MAEDAFALSPISARASLPSEADYGAIRDAFMETARGRWFLDEYARRNRNADTAQVLDAVARIEAGMAPRAPASMPTPPSADSIRDALLDAIRPVIADARAAADLAMTASHSAETIAGGRRGARIIREISWSLRETGTDPRICNILDAQLLALDSVHEHADADMRPALIGEVFDDLVLRIEELATGSVPTQAQPEPVERVDANIAVAEPDIDVAQPFEVKSFETKEPAVLAPDIPDAVAQPESPVAIVADDALSSPTKDELAADDAVLDLIAMEMTAPDMHDNGGDNVDEFDGGDDAIAEMQILADGVVPEQVAAPVAITATLPVEALPEASPSLGAALIASGIVRQPRRASDALAPFRRMSQIEKIAFFS